MRIKCLGQNLAQSKDSVALAKKSWGDSRIFSFVSNLRFLSRSSGSPFNLYRMLLSLASCT